MIQALTVNSRVEVEIPTIPNFLKVGEKSVPIADFPPEELTRIAECWKENLLEKASS